MIDDIYDIIEELLNVEDVPYHVQNLCKDAAFYLKEYVEILEKEDNV